MIAQTQKVVPFCHVFQPSHLPFSLKMLPFCPHYFPSKPFHTQRFPHPAKSFHHLLPSIPSTLFPLHFPFQKYNHHLLANIRIEDITIIFLPLIKNKPWKFITFLISLQPCAKYSIEPLPEIRISPAHNNSAHPLNHSSLFSKKCGPLRLNFVSCWNLGERMQMDKP